MSQFHSAELVRWVFSRCLHPKASYIVVVRGLLNSKNTSPGKTKMRQENKTLPQRPNYFG